MAPASSRSPTRRSRRTAEKKKKAAAAEDITTKEEAAAPAQPKPKMEIDTSAMPQLNEEEEDEVPLSNMFTCCLLFIVHTCVNGMMLSSYNTARCMFWKLGACPPDLDWITTWLSVGHLQVALLLSFIAKAVYNRPAEEAKLSYLVMCILCMEITVGITAKPYLHRPFLLVQLAVWTLLLLCLGWFTYSEYDELLNVGGSVLPTPRELFARIPSTRSMGSVGSTASAFSTTTSSFHSRKRGGFHVVSIALAVLAVGALIQTFELVMLEGKNSYYGGSSSNTDMATGPFQNSADMVIMDKWIVAVILAATLRFFDHATQRNVLMGKTGCLMLHLIVLTSDNGEMMDTDARRAAGVGAFFMILTAVVGIL